jgi:hypothetical protein
MRRILVVIGIALVAAAAGASAAQAGNLVNVRAELPFAVHNLCTDEDVVGEIRVHFLLNLTINGNNVSGMELLQYSVHGVGQTTGASYAGNESGHAPFNASLVNGQATMTNSVTFHLTTPGGGNNMVIRGRSHTTINANGDVTVSYDDLSSSCG